MTDKVTIDFDLALDILEVLRLTPIYALLNSEHEDELGDDFKPHKWQGYEIEHADKSITQYRKLLAEMEAQSA